MLREQRLNKLVEAVNLEQIVTIEQLMALTHASKATIRRDIDELVANGLISKIRGGAASVDKMPATEPSQRLKKVLYAEEKRRLAAAVLTHIKEGDRIILDAGTTTLEVAKLLGGQQHLTVVTYDLLISDELSRQPTIDLMVVGGMMRKNYYSFYGNFAESMLKDIRVDKAIMGADAISPRQGIMSYTTDDVNIKRLIIECAKEVIMVCDHSKFSSSAFIHVDELQKVSRIITDRGVSEDVARQITEMGIVLELV